MPAGDFFCGGCGTVRGSVATHSAADGRAFCRARHRPESYGPRTSCCWVICIAGRSHCGLAIDERVWSAWGGCLIVAAALLRAGAAWAGENSVAWMAVFGLLCVLIAPMLWRVRADGLWGCARGEGVLCCGDRFQALLATRSRHLVRPTAAFSRLALIQIDTGLRCAVRQDRTLVTTNERASNSHSVGARRSQMKPYTSAKSVSKRISCPTSVKGSRRHIRFHSAFPTIDARTAVARDTAPNCAHALESCRAVPMSSAIGIRKTACAPVTIPVRRFQSWPETLSSRFKQRALPTANAVHDPRAPTAQSSPIHG